MNEKIVKVIELLQLRFGGCGKITFQFEQGKTVTFGLIGICRECHSPQNVKVTLLMSDFKERSGYDSYIAIAKGIEEKADNFIKGYGFFCLDCSYKAYEEGMLEWINDEEGL